MITDRDLREIWAQVQENGRKLTACTRHDFEPDGPVQPLRTKYRCKNCDGTVDSHAFHWYTFGLQHGGQ